MPEADELVELIVPARERPGVARALLTAARRLGLQPAVVLSTSTGYRVPAAVADLADELLAADEPGGRVLVYVAAPPGGRVGYRRGGQADEAEQPADEQAAEAEMPEPVRNRRRGGRK